MKNGSGSMLLRCGGQESRHKGQTVTYSVGQGLEWGGGWTEIACFVLLNFFLIKNFKYLPVQKVFSVTIGS